MSPEKAALSEDQLKALMLAALAGNARAYEQLLSLAAERLRRYFRRRLERESDVEDLVQEVLIAIHRKRASYAPALPFTAWLHGIARHRLIDHFRREGRRVTVPLDDAAELQETGGAEAAMAAADLETLLATLPPKQATAIRLTRISGYSVSEAAAQSGQSESAVKVNVHRGLGKLIARMGGKE